MVRTRHPDRTASRGHLPSKVPVPQNINSGELPDDTREIFRDGHIRRTDDGRVERARSDPAIAGHLEIFMRLFGDRDRMNAFGTVMNEGEAQVGIIVDDIPRSQTGEEILSAEMGNDSA